jgi:hypothetical protein
MMNSLAILRVALVAACGVFAQAMTREDVINQLNGDIPADSDIGRHLLSHARQLDQNNQQNVDYSFLGSYSVKFQGCHHVQQWNNDNDDDDDVRIKTKRLVRFRLCPRSECTTDTAGCTSKYGDYVVDMNTFVYAYLNAKADNGANMCADVAKVCNNMCNGSNDCVANCYSSYSMNWCLSNKNKNRELENAEFDPINYASCSKAYFGNRRELENNYNGQGYYDQDTTYYIGPYCADQGGEIRLGVFTDGTCTSFAQNGESMFYSKNGYTLPYSGRSIVTSMCLSCSSSSGDGGYSVNELCSDIYYLSGKCETRMNIGYPNESSCSYIEGIKIIREDGVIRTSVTKKSKAAAVCIGLFLTIAVLLAGYVFYLRTKLSRAKVNLAAASQTLA